MKAQYNFTKKDLIVVLACIVFLIANLAAVGPRGRQRAKEAVCLSNLRKWGFIFQQFAADNDAFFMQGWTPFTSPPELHKHYWMEALRPYYGNMHTLRCCPEATVAGSEVGQGPFGGVQPDATFYGWGVFPGVCGQPSTSWLWVVACDYGSYGINGYVQNPPLSTGIFQGHEPEWNWRTANVPGADNIPLFLGAQWTDGWPHYRNDPPAFQGERWDSVDQMKRFCLNRHNGFVNSAFLDFSARKVGLKELWKLKWHRMFEVDGPWTIAGGVVPQDWPVWMQDFQDY
jgi:hypothetical protein